MNVGEVRVADDEDIKNFKFLIDLNDDWKEEYNKNRTTVLTKSTSQTNFKMIKVQSTYNDVSAAILYDVIQDPEYRKQWDQNMIDGYEICCLNPNNDIGYYSLKVPSPLKNRDFVTLRSWLDTGKEYVILNHSVQHDKCPPKKGYVRGISYITGYLIRPLEETSCQFSYLTQCDPKGSLPVWVVNKLTQVLAPKMIKRIHTACAGYIKWKAKHNENFKPWLYPEQCTLPRVDMKEVTLKSYASTDSLNDFDESGLQEDDFKDDDV